MSSFAETISAIVHHRDTEFIKRVAEDYKLDFDELKAKYTETSEKASVKVAKKRKATVVVDGEEVPKKTKGERSACEGITAKKEPCKFSALKGGCFCLRHQKAHDEEEANKAAGLKPGTKKPKAPKVVKEVVKEPLHEHEVDGDVHEDCKLCQTHGAIFGDSFEAEEAPLEERLKNIIGGAEEEEEFSDAEFPEDE